MTIYKEKKPMRKLFPITILAACSLVAMADKPRVNITQYSHKY